MEAQRENNLLTERAPFTVVNVPNKLADNQATWKRKKNKEEEGGGWKGGKKRKRREESIGGNKPHRLKGSKYEFNLVLPFTEPAFLSADRLIR